MDGVPAKCPTCSTAIPEGAVRCPGCGRVFGEDNRCPHCHAIAAVRPSGGDYLCLACSKPRERLPLTVVLGEGDERLSVPSKGRSSIVPGAPGGPPAPGGGLRALGVLGITGGVLGAALATALLGTGALGLVIALAVGMTGVVAGAAALRTASRLRDEAQDRARRAIELRVLTLAEQRGGDLTATDVAKALRITPTEADAALTRMSDGTRITAEIDESAGVLHFVFHELTRKPPKTRVAIDDAPGAGAAEADAEATDAGAAPSAKKRALEGE
jgi:hypothetical protein